VHGFTSRIWTTREGLPQNLIRTVLQTKDGYLWIGTSNAGLVRFDGVSFTTFDIANTPGFPSNWISALYEAPDGALWIGTGSGLARYHRGIFTFSTLGPDPAQNLIRAIQAGPGGELWVASSAHVVRRDGERWVPIPLGDPSITTALLDRTAKLWIASPTVLIEWHDGKQRTWTTKDGLPGGPVEALFLDTQQRLWVGTTQGLAFLNDKTGRFQTELAAGIGAIREDANGVLWIGAEGQLFERASDGRVTAHRLFDQAEGARIRTILPDRDGQLWLGIDGGPGGLIRLHRQSLSVLTYEDGLPCNNAAPILQGLDGTMWIGTICIPGGVTSLAGSKTQTFGLPWGVLSLTIDPSGRVWAGNTAGQLFRLEGRQFVRIPGPQSMTLGAIAALYAEPSGDIWIGAARGLFHLHDGEWTSYLADDGLPGNEVLTIAAASDGALWIGTTGGASRYANGTFTNITPAQGLPAAPVRAIHPDTDGVVWIGTYGGGLSRLKDGRVVAYGRQGGALDTSVHRILEDDDGYLWLSGDRGIRRVSRKDLNDVAEGRQSTVSAALFDETDGMKTAEANGMGQPAGWRARDGVLWFPTQRGVVRIDPKQASSRAGSVADPIVEFVSSDGAPRSVAGEIVMLAGSSDVEFRFTAPAFDKPERVQFRYRLEGHDRDWIDAGSRRLAYYANLPPGQYRFIVAARGSGGRWSERPAVAIITLQPFLTQRWWVRLVSAVVLLLAAGAVVRWRIERLRRHARELEAAIANRTADAERARDDARAAHDALAGATRELEVSRERGRLLLDQLDVGALLLDPEGTIRHANEPAMRLLDDPTHPLVGRTWSAALPLSDADRARVAARVDAPSPSRLRLPVQIALQGRRYLMEIDARDTPSSETPRILYLYDVTEVYALRSKSEEVAGFTELVGRSTAMHLVFKQIRDVAGADATVLIEGETGAGKELVAQAIHRASPRAERPFVPVNTAGLAESLIASQLFGHRRGAFTGAIADQLGVFEAAHGGTLFLDEIGDIPANVQTSLLRVLQEKEITRLGDTTSRKIDVRFLAATHRDLGREVAEGRFRQDLLYRLRVAVIRVPPLRDRLDDMPALVERFIVDGARTSGREITGLSREAMNALMGYPWPGNVRELKSAIEQATLRASSPILRLTDFPDEIARNIVAAVETLDAQEREQFLDALRLAGGNRSEAARLLGIGRSTFYRKLAAYGLAGER
jgi:DNA-binding NtrC family response regulator/ligand-binding sensor domain-containing protein/outer membrane murein-binding lipoprotein Lpp